MLPLTTSSSLSIIISVLVLILACVYNFILAQSFLLSLRALLPRGLGLGLMVCETALKPLDTHLLS